MIVGVIEGKTAQVDDQRSGLIEGVQPLLRVSGAAGLGELPDFGDH
jgi:hypothetical protein